MTVAETPADDLEVRPGPTEDDPFEVRDRDLASGEWSSWYEQGEYLRRIKGLVSKVDYQATAKRIQGMIDEARMSTAEVVTPPERPQPRAALLSEEPQEERVDLLRGYLQQHPGTRLMDLKQHRDGERGPLYILAKRLLARGELLEHPRTGALSFPSATGASEPRREISVRILEDLPAIRDSDGNDRLLTKNELVRLPDSTARALVLRGKAEEVSDGREELAGLPTAALEALPGIGRQEAPDKGEVNGTANCDPGQHPDSAEVPPEPSAEAATFGPGTSTRTADPPPPEVKTAEDERSKKARKGDGKGKETIARRLPTKLVKLDRDVTGDLIVTADIDGERKEWKYEDLEAEIGNNENRYPALMLDSLRDARKRFLAKQRGEDRSRSNDKGKRKMTSLPEGELWEEDGVLGFSTVREGRILTRTIAEWRESEPELADLIEDEHERARGVYFLSGRPDTEQEDLTLLTDIVKVVDRFVDLPPGEGKSTGYDSPYRTSTAAHIICSAFSDLVSVRPGLMPVAQTESGKTRLTTICARCSYRGFAVGAPTEAVILRALGVFHVTLCIDETKDLPPEVLRLVLTVFKLSFDGQNVARCDLNDQRAIITYPCRGFVALSLKSLDKVPEDAINRGVVVYLGHKTRELEAEEPDLPEFAPMFKDLRTRVTALRLRALAGKIDVRAALKRARELARARYEFRGSWYQLESRGFTKAQTLLLPIVLMGEDPEQVRDVMEVMLRSKIEADEAQKQTLAAECWFALYEEVATLWSGKGSLRRDSGGVPVPPKGRHITTKMIADTVRANLKNEGELLKDEDLSTWTVTKTLKSLQFEIRSRSGSHGASNLVTDQPSFSRGWRNCVRKYGEPGYGDDSGVNKGIEW